MTYKALKFEIEDGIATIILNRPEAANGLNETMAKELGDVALRCDNDDAIRVVILTGSGRFFCAGGDLKDFGTYGDAASIMIKRLADNLHKAISVFARMDAPLIVVVNGIAAGAGLSIAAIGDLVIASENASFTMAYSRAGLSPDGSSSYYLPRVIGLRRTQELMLTNRTINAQEAHDWGLVTQVVPENALLETALKFAGKLTAGSAGAHAAIKKLLLMTFNNGLETQMEIEGRLIAECAGSDNGQEGIRAFLEKRTPEFN